MNLPGPVSRQLLDELSRFTLRREEWRARLLDQALEEENLLLLGAGRSSVRLRPPLDVTTGEIDEMLGRLTRVLQRLSESAAVAGGGDTPGPRPPSGSPPAAKPVNPTHAIRETIL